ncbi:MAG: FAD-dependent oxidoreductase [Thalassobius sp.]|nr:FAD-dependent oxidoreductase [Thalassovita sp.]
MNADLVIVGGGITGLAAAYIAAKNGKKVTVIEADKNFGGLLNTFEIAGNRLEFFYHHFFTHDAEINWLVKELGLEDQLLFYNSSMGVYQNGKIFPFNSPFDLLKFSPINFLDKLRFGFSSIYMGKFTSWKQYENISAYKWLSKWAGKSTTEALWKPMLDIKFGPYASEIPLSWMIGRMKQRLNSRDKGDEKLGYIRGSLQVLLDTLLKALLKLGVKLINNTSINEIEIVNNQVEFLKTDKGDTISGKSFLFTIPTNITAKMLTSSAPQLASFLQQTKYFGAVCVILEMKEKLSDIYWLNVAESGFPFGGIIEHTNFIPPENYNGKHIAYLSRYFADDEPLAKMGNKEIEAMMIPPLKKIYPNFTESQIEKVYTFKTHSAATVCDLNFSKKVPQCKTEIDKLYIANMNHIYPDERSTNNAIRVAAEACKSMGMNADFVPKNASLAGKIGFN